jgi:hypothetical protein
MSQEAARLAGWNTRGLPVRWLGEDWPAGQQPPAPIEPAWPWSLQTAAVDSAWLFYVGHGSRDAWDITDAGVPFDRARVRQLDNGSHLPVVFAAGCETGRMVSCPPNDGSYPGIDGHLHRYVATGGSDDAQRTLIEHYVDDGPTPVETVRSQDGSPARIEPVLPMPFDGTDGRATTIAADWLFNPNGGGIAYFGEAGVAPNTFGCELGGRILHEYQGRGTVLGDMYLRGQYAYWQDFKVSRAEERQAAPRIWLSYVHLYGDPSLRLW